MSAGAEACCARTWLIDTEITHFIDPLNLCRTTGLLPPKRLPCPPRAVVERAGKTLETTGSLLLSRHLLLPESSIPYPYPRLQLYLVSLMIVSHRPLPD